LAKNGHIAVLHQRPRRKPDGVELVVVQPQFRHGILRIRVVVAVVPPAKRDGRMKAQLGLEPHRIQVLLDGRQADGPSAGIAVQGLLTGLAQVLFRGIGARRVRQTPVDDAVPQEGVLVERHGVR